MRREFIARKQTFKYPRPADVRIGEFNEPRWKRALAGERCVIRFAMDAEPVIVHDQVLGDVKTAAGEVDDFVIRKADGFPTYHFAVVIDDELMGVTHILRAQEHLANTPRHVAMQRALSRLPEHGGPTPFRTPIYAHMPLIFNMDGTKMSKRDRDKAMRGACKTKGIKSLDGVFPPNSTMPYFPEGTYTAFGFGGPDFLEWIGDTKKQLPTDVLDRLALKLQVALPEIEVYDFRRNGYLPEAIINFIALLGWNPGMKLPDGKDLEKFDMDFLAKHFAIDRIGKTSAKFDRAKLLSFNADYIGKLSDADFAARWRSFLAEYEPNILAALNRGPGASPGTPRPQSTPASLSSPQSSNPAPKPSATPSPPPASPSSPTPTTTSTPKPSTNFAPPRAANSSPPPAPPSRPSPTGPHPPSTPPSKPSPKTSTSAPTTQRLANSPNPSASPSPAPASPQASPKPSPSSASSPPSLA